MIDDSIRKELNKLKPYIPGKSADSVEAELGISGVVKLASNENPLGPSPKALEALGKRVETLRKELGE